MSNKMEAAVARTRDAKKVATKADIDEVHIVLMEHDSKFGALEAALEKKPAPRRRRPNAGARSSVSGSTTATVRIGSLASSSSVVGRLGLATQTRSSGGRRRRKWRAGCCRSVTFLWQRRSAPCPRSLSIAAWERRPRQSRRVLQALLERKGFRGRDFRCGRETSPERRRLCAVYFDHIRRLRQSPRRRRAIGRLATGCGLLAPQLDPKVQRGRGDPVIQWTSSELRRSGLEIDDDGFPQRVDRGRGVSSAAHGKGGRGGGAGCRKRFAATPTEVAEAEAEAAQHAGAQQEQEQEQQPAAEGAQAAAPEDAAMAVEAEGEA